MVVAPLRNGGEWGTDCDWLFGMKTDGSRGLDWRGFEVRFDLAGLGAGLGLAWIELRFGRLNRERRWARSWMGLGEFGLA